MLSVIKSLILIGLAAGLSVGHLAVGQTSAPASSAASDWEYPLIKGFGKVRSYPDAAVQPDPQKEYKVLFSIAQAARAKDQFHPGFEQVARLLNLFGLAGVPSSNLKVVLVVHGEAMPTVLDDAHYREKFQTPNPNTELLKKLKDAGVTLYACAQGLADHEFKPEWLIPEVKPALAALTVLPIYQLAGYALIPE